TSDVHVLLTLALIFIGAVLGDGLSYLIGYRMHRRVHRMQFFQDRPHWLPTAERVFARFGIPALAFGRFIGPLRPVLPITAGVLRLSPRIFIPLNLVTGLAWATIVTLPAYQLSDYLQAGQWTPAIMLVCGVLLLAGVAILVAARLRKL
ncbi:MAG: DedA family protein, partial [Gammaproteobacteria bacterium AqS3]|nr:DedA family protein [Gammaproteobacteria bacterium AqS3]